MQKDSRTLKGSNPWDVIDSSVRVSKIRHDGHLVVECCLRGCCTLWFWKRALKIIIAPSA